MASKRTPAKRTPAKRAPGKASHMRAVSPGERAPQPAPKPADRPKPTTKPTPPRGLIEAVAGGNYLEILAAQRSELAELVRQETGQVKVTALRQLLIVSKEIEALTTAEPGSKTSVVAATDDDDWDSSAI